jgi:hypothetical protein
MPLEYRYNSFDEIVFGNRILHACLRSFVFLAIRDRGVLGPLKTIFD